MSETSVRPSTNFLTIIKTFDKFRPSIYLAALSTSSAWKELAVQTASSRERIRIARCSGAVLTKIGTATTAGNLVVCVQETPTRLGAIAAVSSENAHIINVSGSVVAALTPSGKNVVHVLFALMF